MKIMRKIIEIDEERCDGCGHCVPGCAEGALAIVDGKARVMADKFCDGLGACIGDCPQGALKIIEREAEEFDEAAVEAYLAASDQKAEENKAGHHMQGTADVGCPSAHVKTFSPAPDITLPDQPQPSQLTHWPVQIRLIPPTAPFLQNANLLILADCGAVALANLHGDFLKDRVVMMGCPKFDDKDDYVNRFARIFKANVVCSVTVVRMEVPCCSALPVMVQKGLEQSGKNVDFSETVVSTRGEIVGQKKAGLAGFPAEKVLPA